MTFLDSSRQLGKQKKTALSVTLLGTAALLTGCGGSSSSSTNSALARVVNAIAGGGSATVRVNNKAINSNLSSFGASSYQSVGDGQGSLTFTLSAAAGTAYPAVTQALLDGSYYSFVLMGRADITDSTDARYPALIAISDNLSTPSSGNATLRVIDAAPDAGNVDVVVNNATISSNAFYKSSSATSISAGTMTVQINKASTGTTLVAPQSLSLTAGHDYTLFIIEPTLSPAPAYSVQSTDDTSAAS